MNSKTYLVIGLIMVVIVYGISTFFGSDIVVWAREQEAKAVIAGQGGIGQAVMEPIIFVMNNDIPMAILVTLFWPAVFLWLIFILVLLLIVAGVDVTSDIEYRPYLERILFI